MAPRPVEPGDGPLDRPLGMLERGRGRAGPATSSVPASSSRRLSNAAARLGPLVAADERDRPVRSCSRRGSYVSCRGSYERPLGGAHSARSAYPPVTFRPSHRRDGMMTVKRVGIVGSGIMGSGIAEVAAKAGLRGRAAQPGAEHRRRDGRRAREVAGQAGRAGQARSRRARRGARPGPRRRRPRRAADCDLVHRVDRRGPRRQEAPLHRARPHLRRAHDPRDQHVDAARRRDGDGHRPPRQGVRRPLLQPRADDGARRGRARDHVERRDDRRRPPRSPPPAARTRCR